MFIKGRSSPGKPPVDGTRSGKKKGSIRADPPQVDGTRSGKKRGRPDLFLPAVLTPE